MSSLVPWSMYIVQSLSFGYICTPLWNKCDSTYRKVPVVGRLNFELWVCKVKIHQNIVPKSILGFHMLLNHQLKDLVQKQRFHVKIDLWIAKTPIGLFCTDSQILKSLFLKINFSQIFLWHPQWKSHISRTQCPI